MRRARRPGLTLLEVLVSLAIFLLALVALSRLIGIGSDLARDANQQTEALRLAQSKLHEVMAGVVSVENGNASGTFDENPDFQWSVDIEPSTDDVPDLYNITVTATRARPDGTQMSVSVGHVVYDPTKRGTYVNTNSTTGSGQ
jgi:type II secretion system protein I